METVRPPLMDGGGPQGSSPRAPPSPKCSCCWPKEACEAAATLLAEIEEICASKQGEGEATPYTPRQQQQQQQQQLQQQDASCCLPVVMSLVSEALELIVDVLRLFGPERVVLSFNGGKDAVAILHLYRAALVKYTRLQQQEQQQQHEQVDQQQQWQEEPEFWRSMNSGQPTHAAARCGAGLLPKPRAVYFHAGPQEFPEVENFVRQTAEEFAVSVEVYYCDWATGLQQFFACHSQTPFAFLLGTRRSDPQGARETLEFMQPSSRWLPPFLRVHPLLRFGYGHVWMFLRQLRLPYCSLYDQGYTSIGTMENTLPNPLLTPTDGRPHLPAYELRLWDKEREGRIRRQGQAQHNTEV